MIRPKRVVVPGVVHYVLVSLVEATVLIVGILVDSGRIGCSPRCGNA